MVSPSIPLHRSALFSNAAINWPAWADLGTSVHIVSPRLQSRYQSGLAHSFEGLAFVAYWGIVLFGYDTSVPFHTPCVAPSQLKRIT